MHGWFESSATPEQRPMGVGRPFGKPKAGRVLCSEILKLYVGAFGYSISNTPFPSAASLVAFLAASLADA